MKFDRFMIGAFNEGQINAVRPFAIPDNAFSEMRNCYVFRQRIKKRFGSRWLGNTQSTTRLRTVLVPVANVVTTPINLAVGQAFSIGQTYFTVTSIAALAPLLTTGVITAQVTAANQVTFSATPSPVYFYPALPVMGLLDYEQSALNNETTIGFDTRFAYRYNLGTAGWERLATEAVAGDSVWSGTNADFFWATTWRGGFGDERILFVTNYVVADGIRYFDGTTWAKLAPKTLTAAGNNIITARLIVVFKNHLVLLNTIENVTGVQRTFVNRARWSQIGSPLAVDAFQTDIPGKGGGADAATSEAIVSCEFLRDRLIVYFERSTWELAYTGNQIYPFVWQKINTELGAESTFSVVPFDKVLLSVGNVGILACNASNVERIDQKIPDEVFKIHNGNEGVFRVYGIRDYFSQMVYWTFPDQTENIYPNRVLVYNYEFGSWAFNDDTITVFGYFQPQDGVSWDSTTVTWDDAVSWDSPQLQTLFRQVTGGNQQGFTFFIDSEQAASNSANLQITNMTTTGLLTVMSHNLLGNQYVWIQDAVGITELNQKIFRIEDVIDDNTIQLDLRDIVPTGVYAGGGTMATVSRVDMRTKEFNFYAKDGRNAYIQKVDFLVDRVNDAQLAVDYYTSSNIDNLVAQGNSSGSLLGDGLLDLGPYALYPQEANQTRLWHPVYLNAEGEVIQLRIGYTDELMIEPESSRQPFEIHSFTMYTVPTSRLQ